MAPVERSAMAVRFAANILNRLFREDQGATAIEYALIASILGIALVPVLVNTTNGVASLYTRVQYYFSLF
ncbi:MAG: Flp family type IVb pilin [Rhizobiales bacterium]|nr:Flp family type IVb pilin [Hyphomicrobiales bacterium]MBI3672833.1 Flp family type IVb pilin [Hyphomicrobiales bacterium]